MKPSNSKRKPSKSAKPKEQTCQENNAATQRRSKERYDSKRLEKPNQEWNWYAPTEEVAKDMASLAFNKSIGQPIAVPQTIESTVPGLIGFGYYPTVGATSDTFGTKDINYQTRAANAYYQYVTQGFTSINTLEAPDLFMTGVAASSLIATMLNIKRAYGVMSYYLQLNPYFAKYIVETLGFNYESMKSNMANLRAEYNLRVDEINKTIAIPKNFALLNRWIYVNSYIFTDSEAVDQCTMYAYIPLAALKYDATSATTGTCLKYVRLGDANSTFTVQQYFSLIDGLIAALTDEDVRDSFGAIRRVYNDSDFAKLTPLTDDYKTPIAHTDIAALQMHNMVTSASTNVDWSVQNAGGYMPESVSATGSPEYDVAMYQTANGIIRCEPFAEIRGSIEYTDKVSVEDPINGMNGGNVIIDCFESAGTPKDILDITANIQFFDGANKRIVHEPDSVSVQYPVIARSENIWRIFATFNLAETGQNVKYSLFQYFTNVQGLSTPAPQASVMPLLARTLNVLTKMDSHPLIYTNFLTDASSPFPNTVVGELDKFTTMSVENLALLHNRCMYQMTLLPANTRTTTR